MANDSEKFRTWIEISRKSALHNYRVFRGLIKPKTKLWAVVKSNAYGHGLAPFSELAESCGVDGFCVDSIVEGNRLRREGIRKPILILGPTLPARLSDAAACGITVSVSNFEALKALVRSKTVPSFHLKVDTGFHRQGFYVEELPKVIRQIANSKGQKAGSSHLPLATRHSLTGVFTHFAVAKDVTYLTYTELQCKKFKEALRMLRKAGFRNLTAHAAATGAASINSKYHFNAVRIGMGLYGFHASPELEMQLPRMVLKPVLHWKTVISEVKRLHAGDYVGYDATERMRHAGAMAILPIGYWHGFPRALSSIGNVLVDGKFAKVIGRVSMDLTAIDVTGIRCRPGTVVTLLGKSGREEIRAQEAARAIGTTHYELLTRLNPLMERILV
ncbi:MAG: alanine racemase [Candidatus Liptonbacteria bacterium]|nr:alanine racemase [Candidatus Liptonbacteria bacterium]